MLCSHFPSSSQDYPTRSRTIVLSFGDQTPGIIKLQRMGDDVDTDDVAARGSIIKFRMSVIWIELDRAGFVDELEIDGVEKLE